MSINIDGKLKLKLARGQTFKVLFRLKDDVGELCDITGYGARLQARVSATPGAVLVLDMNTVDASLIIDGEAGEIYGSKAWSETSAYQDGTYPWELGLITPTDERFIIGGGKLVVKTGVIQ